MPELAEVARVVYFIRKHLVGKTVSTVVAQHDDLIFGKVGTSAPEFQQKMQGKKIVGAAQQGKYFWMLMSEPPHPVMHFGMTGWLNIKGANSCHYRATEDTEVGPWPPKFWKFQLTMDDEEQTEAAFVDARRLGRVRLVDCPGDDIRSHTPLKENGPDPIVDKGTITEPWLSERVSKKKVPIKAFLLDQAIISGLGNWMADEVLYHAQIHPEQVSNTLTGDQVAALHSAIHYVCATSVDLLGEASRFPADWLMHHRWNKGKKEASTMLNGDPVVFITVGGRTSAIVPTVQQKTGNAAKGAADDPGATPSKGRSKAVTKIVRKKVATSTKKPVLKTEEQDGNEGDEDSVPKTPLRKRKAAAAAYKQTENAAGTSPAKKSKTRGKTETTEPTVPLRRGRSATAKK